MDPQVKSILTSMGMAAATAVTTWAATKGFISGSDQAGDANALVTVAGAVVMGGIAWYKTRSVTPKAMISAINSADNGVKVVADATVAPQVNAPLK